MRIQLTKLILLTIVATFIHAQGKVVVKCPKGAEECKVGRNKEALVTSCVRSLLVTDPVTGYNSCDFSVDLSQTHCNKWAQSAAGYVKCWDCEPGYAGAFIVGKDVSKLSNACIRSEIPNSVIEELEVGGNYPGRQIIACKNGYPSKTQKSCKKVVSTLTDQGTEELNQAPAVLSKNCLWGTYYDTYERAGCFKCKPGYVAVYD
jgi:hypothetical protein